MSFFLALFALASAADLGIRDVSGVEITLDRASLLVFWSMDDAATVASVRALDEAGVPVIAVNTDPANRRAQVVPFARTHGLDATIVADPTGELHRRYPNEATLLAADGKQIAGTTLARATASVATATR